ncbi:MAG: S8 family serine peptidase [Chloroflexota bacterium]
MKAFKFLSVSIVLLLVFAGLRFAALPSQAAADRPGDVTPLADIPTDQIIIQYKETSTIAMEGLSAVDEMARLSGVAGVELAYYRPMSDEGTHVLKLPQALAAGEMAGVIARLAALPEVAYVEPDAIMQPLETTPDDPQYANQWHYFAPGAGHYGINAPAAWDITTGSASIVVAVIDTGITSHTDLAGRTVPGYDFITDVGVANDGGGRDADPSDPGDWVSTNECGYTHSAHNSSWHGTHVAGTIGAATDNGAGVAGVNWVSRILPVRVLGKCGGYASDISEGMKWAAGLSVSGVPANANPAKVLNLSLGGAASCSATYQNAINAILAQNVTIVVAAGNDYKNASGYQPAGCNGVVTVAATDRNGAMAYYSNYGSVVEISAPGGDTYYSDADGVLSTLNDGTQGPGNPVYVAYQGTSMAAPHVAGVASLLLSKNPGLSPALVSQILQKSVTAFPPVSCDSITGRPTTWCQCTTANCGSGIVNAFGAVSPVITSLSPSQAVTDTTPVLTVYGANFNASATIYYSGTAHTTYFVSSTELTTTLTLTDTHVEGTYPVVVTGTYGAAGTLTSNTMNFVVRAKGGPVYLPLIAKPKPLPQGPFLVSEDVDLVEGFSQIYPTDSVVWVGHHWADCTEDTADRGVARSLFKFDISAIPASASIAQATFNVFLNGNCYYSSQAGGTRQVVAYRVTTPWSETSPSWANQPGTSDAYGSVNISLASAAVNHYHSLDITALVQGWVNGSIPNYGLMLRGPEAGDTNGAFFSFSSSEDSASYVPYLTITYNGALSAPGTLHTVSIPMECKVTSKMTTCTPVGGENSRK